MTYVKRSKRAKPDPELVKLADSLLANYKKPEDLIGENGLLKQLTKMLVERALATTCACTTLMLPTRAAMMNVRGAKTRCSRDGMLPVTALALPLLLRLRVVSATTVGTLFFCLKTTQ